MGGKRSACVSLQFLVLLTASLALVPAYGGRVEFDPPRLKPANEYVVSAGGNLTLECEAKQPITWDVPSNQEIDDMQEATSNISTSVDPHAEYPYKLRLELFNLTVIDVGFYTCLFNTSENYDGDMNELVATGQAQRTYVYVDDPEHLMVPMVGVVTGTQYSSLIVPCRPTAPTVRVNLYRDGSEVTDSVTFDPHRGFEIVIKSITENSITCVATREGVPNNEHDMYLSVNLHTMSVPKPQINDSFNGNTVLGGHLHLDCFVSIALGIPFHVKWKYPNEKYIDPKRVNITETTIWNNGDNDSNTRIGKSTIIISNITAEDIGWYECEVFDANKNQNSDKKFIKVLQKETSYINLSEPAGIYTITKESGKLAVWAIPVDAFPIPTLTWFDNHNNELSPNWSNDHLIKHEVKLSHKEALIRINRLTLADGGIYRLQAKNAYETKNLNLTLVVTEKPTVDLGTKKFFMHGTIASIACRVTGYPLPEVKWTFQPCLENCSVPLEEKKGELTVEGGYTETSILKIPVKQSGFLTCAARNIKGTNQSTSVFYVSDIEDGFGIIGNDKGNPIAVGDNVTLTCIASIYTNFTGTNWYKLPENKIIDDYSVNGVSITRKRTELSNEVIMSIPKITKSHTSTYACRAHTTEEEGTTVERKMKLLVQDAIKPNITSSSMNSSEIQLSLGQQNHFFYCRASGIPIPEIKWYKDDVLMVFNDINPDDKNNRIKLTDKGKRLEFTHIKEEDRGKYTCKATSRVGEAARSQSIALLNGDFKAGYIATIIVLAIIFILLITYLILKIKKEKRIRKQLCIDGLLHFEEGATECLNPELGLDEQAELLPYDKKWEFPREMLKLGKQLGSGAYGVVMKAVAQNIVDGEETTIVAVKQVKKTADSTFVKALASELKIMVHLGKHLNVVNLLGACTKNVTKHELFVIVEYCRFGNLHNYLLRHRGNFIDQVVRSTDVIDPTIGIEMINRAYSISSNKSGGNKYAALPLLRSGSHGDSGLNSSGLHSPGLDTNNTVISMIPNGDIDDVIVSNGSVQPDWRSNYRGDYNYNRDVRPISTQDLLCWSFQVARGMEYLANRKVLHGDLAARNILLADDNIVKICDFGLAKSMYKNDNYKKKGDGLLPVKWMAIESIRDRVFSTQSDVWSYGIVLWELFSLASTPYPGMEADEKFYNRIIEGYRMEKPQYANKQIYETMLECWRSIPTHRPSFTQLAERLGYLLEDSVRKHYIDLNDPYMDMNSRWIAERGDSDYLAMMSSPDYGNLVSPTATHDYVNDPFGGPTSVNPLSPDNMDTEGYLCMSPAKNGVVTKDAPVFNFNTATPKRMPDLLDEDKTKPVELIPMLDLDNEPQRPGSDSDLGESNPTSPRSPLSPPDGTSFTNPSYQSMFKIPTTNGNVLVDDLIITKDNYVNMSKKDSGFCENLDPKLSPSAFANPSYVAMNAKNKVPHIYNNVPSSTVV